MSFSINLGDWNSVFAVPTSVVDKHIKLAGAAQLKVLLWVLRNAGTDFTIDDMSKALSMHPMDAKDAMQYWIETGLIAKKDDAFYPSKAENKNQHQNEPNINQNNKEAEKKEAVKPPAVIRPLKPDPAFVSKRISENSDLASLMQEAQIILGRPISNGDCSSLIMIHDYYGLPVDVIVMLLQYACEIQKPNMRYIEKVAASWAGEEIDNLQKAENKLIELDKTNRAWRKIEKIMGLDHRSPTSKETEMVKRWIYDWNYQEDMIREAYERCVNAKGKYIASYIDSIIKRWHNLKITTIAQAMEENKKQGPQNNRQNDTKSRPTSYNIEEYERSSIFDDIPSE